MRKEQPSGDPEFWYVMLHLEPAVIDRQLLMVNERRKADGKPILFYIIPFSYLKKATPERGVDDRAKLQEIADNNSLRNYLHDFVFIKATEREIRDLVDQQWNREGRLHLHFYRSRYGNLIRVPEGEMRPLIRLMVEQRQKFSFGPPIDDASSMESVIIKTGLFKSYKASVLKLRHTAEGISLTLGIPVFNGEATLRLSGYTASSVKVPRRLERLLDDRFVTTVEDDLLGILRRRVRHRDTDATHREDLEKLNYFSTFNYLTFDDTTAHNHFRALMLLCATLRSDKLAKDELIPVVRQLLGDTLQPETDEQAFLAAILFVATHDADYRSAAKHYEQTHGQTSGSLQKLMPLVKAIRTR